MAVVKTLPAVHRLICCWSSNRNAGAYFHLPVQQKQYANGHKMERKTGYDEGNEEEGENEAAASGVVAKGLEKGDQFHKGFASSSGHQILTHFTGLIHYPGQCGLASAIWDKICSLLP